MPLLQLLQMRRLRPRGRRQLAEALQRALSGVFASVVDVLSVVPEAGVDGLRADGHGAGPRGAAACENQCFVSNQATSNKYDVRKFEEERITGRGTE